MYNRKVWK